MQSVLPSVNLSFSHLSHSNPPPDHWALSSGLPTYVAESGYVSFFFLYITSWWIILGQRNRSGCGSVGRAGHLSIRRSWFNPRLLRSTCRSVLGQDTEPQIAPDGRTICVRMCVNEFLMSRLALCGEVTRP